MSMDSASIVHVDEGTEITVGACIGDLGRVADWLIREAAHLDFRGEPSDEESGLAADTQTAIRLLGWLAERVPDPEEPPGLNVEDLRDLAHHEYEIAKLMGPSDDHERAWLDYTLALVALTDAYLATVEAT